MRGHPAPRTGAAAFRRGRRVRVAAWMSSPGRIRERTPKPVPQGDIRLPGEGYGDTETPVSVTHPLSSRWLSRLPVELMDAGPPAANRLVGGAWRRHTAGRARDGGRPYRPTTALRPRAHEGSGRGRRGTAAPRTGSDWCRGTRRGCHHRDIGCHPRRSTGSRRPLLVAQAWAYVPHARISTAETACERLRRSGRDHPWNRGAGPPRRPARAHGEVAERPSMRNPDDSSCHPLRQGTRPVPIPARRCAKQPDLRVTAPSRRSGSGSWPGDRRGSRRMGRGLGGNRREHHPRRRSVCRCPRRRWVGV